MWESEKLNKSLEIEQSQLLKYFSLGAWVQRVKKKLQSQADKVNKWKDRLMKGDESSMSKY